MIPIAKPLIGHEERIAVDRVLRSGMIAAGPEVAAFERDFADQVVAGQDCGAVSFAASPPSPDRRRPRVIVTAVNTVAVGYAATCRV